MENMNDCEGCVHSEGHNPNYMGNCENCIRNPKYADYYWNEKEDQDE